MRRFGQPPQAGRRYQRRPGVYGVLERDGAVLLTHQAAPRSEFQLPGGGIDPGETPSEALGREVLEETGWRIAGARRLGVYRRFTFMPEYDIWAEKICILYTARPVTCLGAPAEPDHSALWMAPHLAVDALENDGDRHYLRQWLGL